MGTGLLNTTGSSDRAQVIITIPWWVTVGVINSVGFAALSVFCFWLAGRTSAASWLGFNRPEGFKRFAYKLIAVSFLLAFPATAIWFTIGMWPTVVYLIVMVVAAFFYDIRVGALISRK
jgi:hypothetical protein